VLEGRAQLDVLSDKADRPPSRKEREHGANKRDPCIATGTPVHASSEELGDQTHDQSDYHSNENARCEHAHHDENDVSRDRNVSSRR